MKLKINVLFTAVSLLTFAVAGLPGCTGADNPVVKEAPPPPPPKDSELKIPKSISPKGQYGAGDRYKKAFSHAPGQRQED
jgi:hypothetical protein